MKKSIISKMSIDAKVAEGIEKYKKKVRAEETKREKEYTKNIEKLQKQLTDARGAKPINLIKPSTKRGSYTIRIIAGDLHGYKMSPKVVSAFFNDIKKIKKPAGSEIILMGDMIDVGGAFAEHHPVGYVREMGDADCYEEDIYQCNHFLNELQGTTKGIKIFQLEGNHEHRVEQWCCSLFRRNKRDAQAFLDRNGPEAVLQLKERGIQYCRQTDFNGTFIRGPLKRGKCLFTHGLSYALNATKNHYDKLGMSVCHGHTHRFDSYYANSAMGTFGAWSFGCLCEPQPIYALPKQGITNHVSGYGIQIVEKNGNFVTIPIPIINGVSMLGHLI
jgi:hypothetical protein